ncbi:Lactate dehydrogenase [Arachidicoccus rhizosphaerae]|uniref:Lactate dehydrogenase n=1 Tax=Arachidicoccus rhizosphaerae TaxID=551991 RepID=A0A1H3ZP64_9BACT|nr:D-glycerate dehydrogenase [Arachidicoccus rhizosphaerae]SEA25201.1 Lactate dehydrogenase [Arachidicoccus rhizosphaerae]
MKVFATKVIPELAKELFANQQVILDEWTGAQPISKEQLTGTLIQGGYDGLLVAGVKIDADIIDAVKATVKVISLLSVGFDNIDLEAATRAGIPVSNTPDVLNDATAQTAFLLMQNVARKAFYNYRRIMDGDWKSESFVKNLGQDLQGKTLGIFGMGSIGTVMAKLCKAAFNMDIIYHNRRPNKAAETQTAARYVSFETLLRQSDILSIHAALTPETTRIFNAEAFEKMKSSAIIINTARGKVIDEPALITALEQKQIWGAGLDVTDPEPMAPDNPLLKMENVAVLPHIGSATVHTRNAMGQLAAENMLLGLSGNRLKTIVNKEVYDR